MADAGLRLVEQHRRAQLSLRAQVLRELVKVWPLLDPTRLEETAPAWLPMATGLITAYRARSADQATGFYHALRATRTGELTAPRPPLLVWADEDQAAATSLRVLGPVAIKHRTGLGQDPRSAARSALVEVAGASGRHVLVGARTALHRAADDDPAAIGYGRYASATACAFCQMLASRGAVYTSGAAAERTTSRNPQGPGRRYHDGCACLPFPLFTPDDPLPSTTQQAERLWVQASAGTGSAGEARAAFRRAVDGGENPAPTSAPGGGGPPTPTPPRRPAPAGADEPRRGTVDRSRVRNLRQQELDTAARVADLGHDVEFLPIVPGRKSPDALIDGAVWEFKAIKGSGPQTVDNRLRVAAAGQSPYVVLDVRRSPLNREQVESAVNAAVRRYDGLTEVWILGQGYDQRIGGE